MIIARRCVSKVNKHVFWLCKSVQLSVHQIIKSDFINTRDCMFAAGAHLKDKEKILCFLGALQFFWSLIECSWIRLKLMKGKSSNTNISHEKKKKKPCNWNPHWNSCSAAHWLGFSAWGRYPCRFLLCVSLFWRLSVCLNFSQDYSAATLHACVLPVLRQL